MKMVADQACCSDSAAAPSDAMQLLPLSARDSFTTASNHNACRAGNISVSRRKPFISDSFKQLSCQSAPSLFLLLLLILLTLTVDRVQSKASILTTRPDTSSPSCEQMESLFNGLSRGRSLRRILDNENVPQKPIPDGHLKTCLQTGQTCCSEEMERRLSNESAKDFERTVQDRLIGLRHTFESSTSRFDRFFRDLLNSAREELHTMFLQTYGPFYERNTAVFTTLFDNLTEYYTTGNSDVETALFDFFESLYRRMFGIMNPLMTVTEARWLCMRPTMDELLPFGDVPKKLTQQVRRSMVAARTFVRALAEARDVLHKVMELRAFPTCTSGLMRMTYCGSCAGHPSDLLPCRNFCLNVMKGCLGREVELETEWNSFIDILTKLLERLKGPYNLESVVNPMNVQISEAIMIFQERGQNISTKVMENCFHLESASNLRFKRNRNRHTELNIDDLQYLSPARTSGNPAPPNSLEGMADTLQEKLVAARNFWRLLPSSLCSGGMTSNNTDDMTSCWNGRSSGPYTSRLAGDGLANQATNPEVVITSPSGLVADQILRLRMAAGRLQRAYDGRHIEWGEANDNSETGVVDGAGMGAIPKAVGVKKPVRESHSTGQDLMDEVSGSGDYEQRPDFLPDQSPTYGQPHPAPEITANTDDEDMLEHGSGEGSGDSALAPVIVVSPEGSHRDPAVREPPVVLDRDHVEEKSGNLKSSSSSADHWPRKSNTPKSNTPPTVVEMEEGEVDSKSAQSLSNSYTFGLLFSSVFLLWRFTAMVV